MVAYNGEGDDDNDDGMVWVLTDDDRDDVFLYDDDNDDGMVRVLTVRMVAYNGDGDDDNDSYALPLCRLDMMIDYD